MKRLQTILSMLSDGCRLADVGCDHAYIPIEAIKSGKASFAYASDIRRGPLQRAKQNIEAAGLSDRAVLRLADGLDGAEEFSPDTVVIAGMGGELIARIINDADFVKNGRVTLILQPMTSAAELRSYLLDSGFSIAEERLAAEDRHVYQILRCVYGGEKQTYSQAELQIGKGHTDTDLLPRLYEKFIGKYERIIRGKTASGLDAGQESEILRELMEIIK